MERAAHAQRPLGVAALSEVEALPGGVWSIPVTIPDSALRYTNVYALECAGGRIALVDAGWDAPESLADLQRGFAAIGADLADVDSVLVTHAHPDHFGLADHVRRVSHARVAMHAADAARLACFRDDAAGESARNLEWLARVGVPKAEVEEFVAWDRSRRHHMLASPPDALLEHHDEAGLPGRGVIAIHTPGHTEGHLCFLEPSTSTLFSGDHILPRITPNVPLESHSGEDPLGMYLGSLARTRALDSRLVLPAHQWRFEALGLRVDELTAHHRRRLDEVLELVASGADTVWEVGSRLTWKRPWPTFTVLVRRVALGEAFAHLAHLEHTGQLTRIDGRPSRWHRCKSSAGAPPTGGGHA